MKSLEEQIEDYEKMNQAKNAFLAGVIRGWTERLKGNENERSDCMKDMLYFSNSIAKSAGVIIYDDN